MSQNSDRWSLTSYFDSFGSESYRTFKEIFQKDITAFLQKVSQEDTVTPADLVKWEELGSRSEHLSSYLGCLSAEDASNEAVRADEAWLANWHAELTKISAVLDSRLAALAGDAAEKLVSDPLLAGAEFSIRRMRENGRHLMPVELESLAADLNVDGLHAWGRLYDTLSGKLKFGMTFPDGHQETVPMARRRALMADPDRKIREAAFRDGQVPWNEHADTFAAALNGITGTRAKLMKRRGLGHFLDEPLFQSAMSRPSLEALISALHEHAGLSHRILRASARIQNAPLHFFDLEAPQIPAPEDLRVSWDDACDIVRRSFHSAYPALGEYFDRLLDRQWIEAAPRENKRPGAFCTGSSLTREQRVFLTHHGTINDVVTLAHEVGHAWHSHVLKDHRPLATGYPMTLAETASNFGEMILLEGLEREAAGAPGLRAYLLDQQMNRAHAYLINIPMRYAFEFRLNEEREKGELSAGDLRKLMESSQRDWYGDTLAEDGLDPMFWASKLHFFISGLSFYNFPYVFGYLLSVGLFARFRSEGPGFLKSYERFLQSTGSADCETVVRESLGEDITRPDFWTTALRSIEPFVAAYEKLATGE